jgi:signal peptidase II
VTYSTPLSREPSPTEPLRHDNERTGALRRVVLIATSAAVIGIDVASKIWASAALADTDRSVGPVTLRLIHNHGVAFGVGAFLPAASIVIVTASIATAVAVAAWRGTIVAPIAAGLVVGGAVANVADRLIGGSVVDFIDIGRWPVFNLADVFVLTGIALLALRTAPEPRSPLGAAIRDRRNGVSSR